MTDNPENVVTPGNGDLLQVGNDIYYTDRLSGTSSATPIVTGSVGYLRGIAKANGKTLSPKDVRALLRTTGTPQRVIPLSALVISRI